LTEPLDALGDWILFFRDIGVTSIPAPWKTATNSERQPPVSNGATLRTVARECSSPSGLAIVWDAPPAAPGEAGRLREADEMLAKMISGMGYRPDDVCVLTVGMNLDGDALRRERSSVTNDLRDRGVKAVIAMGPAAVRLFTGSLEKIAWLRGRFHEVAGLQVMPTHHPSHLLQSPEDKKDTWQDLKAVMELLGKKPPKSRSRG